MEKLCKHRTGFTLVELLIVVAILGILSAVVVPIIGDHAQKAKESAAKESLQILRNAIERYAADHGGVPPGYISNDPTTTPTGFATKLNLEDGYLSKIPQNPFNDLSTVFAVSNYSDFPTTADESSGWIYKPQTKEIKINSTGTDSQNKAYFNY